MNKWLLVLVQTPSSTNSQKTTGTAFRRQLAALGFSKYQSGVYMVHCHESATADKLWESVAANIPPGGMIRRIDITDSQYKRIATRYG